MPEFAVTAIGRDRPGIVAAISGALLELDGQHRGLADVDPPRPLRGDADRQAARRRPTRTTSRDASQRVPRELELEAIAVNRVDDLGVAAARPSHVITRLRRRSSRHRPRGQRGARRARGEHHGPRDAARRRRGLAALRDDHRGGASPKLPRPTWRRRWTRSAPRPRSRSACVRSPPKRSSEPPVAAREVLVYPHPMLKQVAAPAQADDAEAIGRDLFDTMRSFERCVGLAAPQIGELARVVAVDVRGHPKADTRQRPARARQSADRRG